jgi:hypothetical protein
MAAGAQIEGENPLGKDGVPGGDSDAPDVKKYIDYVVTSTNHLFVAPKDKYNDVKDILGLKEADAKTRETAVKLKRGSGFIQVSVTLDSGATLRLACDPAKIGDFKKLRSKKVYGKEVKGSYVPKTQSNR